jgi:hypothetical protein
MTTTEVKTKIVWCNKWGPLQLPNLELWLDANQETFSNNDPVATWTDRSGTGNHATQATADQKPLFKIAIKNSLPAILWDSVDDNLLTSVDLVQPDTWIFVTEIPALAAHIFIFQMGNQERIEDNSISIVPML